MKAKVRIGTWSLFLIIGLSSCTETTNSLSKEEVRTDVEGTRAIVNTRFQNDGCDILLEIEENGQKVLLMPVHLEDSFKVNGAQLAITFHASRIMQSKCQLGRPIVLESVKFIGQNR